MYYTTKYLANGWVERTESPFSWAQVTISTRTSRHWTFTIQKHQSIKPPSLWMSLHELLDYNCTRITIDICARHTKRSYQLLSRPTRNESSNTSIKVNQPSFISVNHIYTYPSTQLYQPSLPTKCFKYWLSRYNTSKAQNQSRNHHSLNTMATPGGSLARALHQSIPNHQPSCSINVPGIQIDHVLWSPNHQPSFIQEP